MQSSQECASDEVLQATIRAAYAEHATQVWHIAHTIYRPEDVAGLPAEVVTSALGLDHPVQAAHLHQGEVVLDLGCGRGIDTFLAARLVGPTGQAIGLDMTHEMIVLAQANAAVMGLTNTRFLEEPMEVIPLPDASVDVVISNGVFNLAPDKDRVFAEARRVVRPGGRLVVADMLLNRHLPAGIQNHPRLWSG